MTHPDILAALARERSATLLAEAEAARRARQARSDPPAVTLGARGFVPRWLAGRRRPGTSAYGRALRERCGSSPRPCCESHHSPGGSQRTATSTGLATTPRQELAATRHRRDHAGKSGR
jgi:hypothetical protein